MRSAQWYVLYRSIRQTVKLLGTVKATIDDLDFTAVLSAVYNPRIKRVNTVLHLQP